MITGVVTSFHQAIIRLIVRGPTGQAQEIEAVIDTGFDGALSLPLADITALGLPWRRRGRALLADGTTSLFDIYEATALWDGAPRRVAVDAADIDPLVGMRLLDGYGQAQVDSCGPTSLRGLTPLGYVIHVARSARCRSVQRKRHPGGRRDPEPEEPPGFPRTRE